MLVLNLGSGVKISGHADVTNVDWSPYLRLRRIRILDRVVPKLLSGERRKRFESLPDNILVHDLAKGIPFADGSVDVVYHSHLLEHLDAWIAPEFMLEVRRVLKPAGVQRIVVPDLERLTRAYLSHLDACDRDPAEASAHDEFIAEMFEQSVRREAYGMGSTSGAIRLVEKVLVGDARRRGETHQWMYDRANLAYLLERSGFENVQVTDFSTSVVASWDRYGLDRDEGGSEYKPGSLYAEATKPS